MKGVLHQPFCLTTAGVNVILLLRAGPILNTVKITQALTVAHPYSNTLFTHDVFINLELEQV